MLKMGPRMTADLFCVFTLTEPSKLQLFDSDSVWSKKSNFQDKKKAISNRFFLENGTPKMGTRFSHFRFFVENHFRCRFVIRFVVNGQCFWAIIKMEFFGHFWSTKTDVRFLMDNSCQNKKNVYAHKKVAYPIGISSKMGFRKRDHTDG